MLPIVFFAGLASAMSHALWNALARRASDPGLVLMAVTVTNGLLCLPIVAVIGVPPMAAWGWVLAGGILNLVTMRAMMETYRRIPFALAYPVVRGMAPLFVTLLGWSIWSETLSPAAMGGVVIISLAVMLLAVSARSGQVDRVGFLLALLSGLSNAGFVITDMRGVRITGDPLVYGLTMTCMNAVTLGLYGLAERVNPVTGLRRFPGTVLACCALSMISYLLVLYGLSHGPSGAVSALRETSIFFGVILAAVMLKERVAPVRWVAATMALCGVLVIRLG